MKCRAIILPNATENWYYHIILCDLISRLWYIAISRPFCKDASQIIYCLQCRIITIKWVKEDKLNELIKD